MEEVTPVLLMVSVLLGVAWVAYRGERDRHRAEVRRLSGPSEEGAAIAALTAATDRIRAATADIVQASIRGRCAVDRAAAETRKKSAPLLGTQMKPQKRRKS